jgi:RNA polymerase sigma factor (sigma-70 family)
MGAPLDRALVARLYRRARAERWSLSLDGWAGALQASADRAPSGKPQTPSELSRYFESLHLEDLAVACACAEGSNAAWEHFIREQRPALYRAADALDPSGGGRDLAGSLYADLYGIEEHQGGRKSLFRYFHGRSSLATWLRAVLAQRHVDRVRVARRFEPLPDDDQQAGVSPEPGATDPDRPRYLGLVSRALESALARLAPRDRLRLGWYYAEGLSLAEIGRLVGEHESTVSRHLARTRRAIRDDIEHRLREEGLKDAEIAECFSTVAEDPGPIDLRQALGSTGPARDLEGIVQEKRPGVSLGGATAPHGVRERGHGGRRA